MPAIAGAVENSPSRRTERQQTHFLTGRLPAHDVDRVLATVLFTDVVGSTDQAAGMGDRRWAELLATHDSVTRAELERSAAERSKPPATGSWPSLTDQDELYVAPARSATPCVPSASACGAGSTPARSSCAVTTSAASPSTSPNGSKSLAQPDEVLVSRTVADLVGGSGIAFADRGTHALKGVSNRWQLFAVEDPQLGSGAAGELVADPPNERAPNVRTERHQFAAIKGAGTAHRASQP
jgi:hypothetical protein